MSAALPPALILAAGLGTRLRPLTYLRAKAAVPVAGRALVARVLDRVARAGVAEAVVNLHHLPATITGLVGDGSAWGMRVRYSWEPLVLGSAGGPRHALPLLEGDPFFLLNADTLSSVDLGGLLAAHRAAGALVTLAVVPNPAPERYGGVLVAGDGRIEGFTRAGDPRPAFHFVGVQVAAHAVFGPLEDGVPAESVSGVYRRLMAERPGSVRAWITDASFHDIGTPRDCLDTSLALAGGDTAALRGAGSTVDPSARLEDTVVWDGVRIGPGCRLEACIVGDGAELPSGFHARTSVVVPADACPPDAPGRRLDGMIVLPL